MVYAKMGTRLQLYKMIPTMGRNQILLAGLSAGSTKTISGTSIKVKVCEMDKDGGDIDYAMITIYDTSLGQTDLCNSGGGSNSDSSSDDECLTGGARCTSNIDCAQVNVRVVYVEEVNVVQVVPEEMMMTTMMTTMMTNVPKMASPVPTTVNAALVVFAKLFAQVVAPFVVQVVPEEMMMTTTAMTTTMTTTTNVPKMASPVPTTVIAAPVVFAKHLAEVVAPFVSHSQVVPPPGPVEVVAEEEHPVGLVDATAKDIVRGDETSKNRLTIQLT